MIEQLENRVLLTAQFNGGVLTLTSVALGETFIVTADATIITVDIVGEGFHAEYPRSGVTALRVTGQVSNSGHTITVAPSILVPATLSGGNGPDLITAGGGNTSIVGNGGADLLTGGAGNDTIEGGSGRNRNDNAGILPADDTIFGGAGNDLIIGGSGPGGADADDIGDIIMGQAGNDTLRGGAGPDYMDAGTGIDSLDYTDKGGEGVDMVFPSPANFEYDPLEPILPGNFPTVGFGEVEEEDNVWVVDEHDFLFEGLDTLSYPFTTHGAILITHANLLNNDNFEVLLGSNSTDSISILNGAANVTSILGNGGVDSITGSIRDDYIDTGDGGETSDRSSGNFDGAVGLDGNDTLLGGLSFHALDGGVGNDSIFGGGAGDILDGGDGIDTIDGGADADLMLGGPGDDFFRTGSARDGEDTLQGDAGFDTADYSLRSASISVTFDLVHDDGEAGELDFVTETTEKIIGTAFNDVLISTPSDTVDRHFVGGAGNDSITCGGGDDTVEAGAGKDTIRGGNGADVVDGGSSPDILDYSTRTSAVIIVGTPNNTGFTYVQNCETIVGGSGDDILDLSAVSYKVSLVGGAGNDALTGGGGNDTLDGGVGADTLDGGPGSDTVDYSSRTTSVSVSFDGAANDGAAGENDNVGSTIEIVIGSQSSDNFSLAGSAEGHNIIAGGGEDTIVGSSFDDTLDGGEGNDSISGGDGDDVLYGVNGNDTLDGQGGNDRVHGGSNNDRCVGGDGSDTLIGGKGSDTSIGNAGSDWVSYYYEKRSVVVALDGLPDDGIRGENDQVNSDVENIQGGKGNDRLLGNKRGNVIRGGGGNDSIIGFNGADTLLGEAGSDTLNGGNHNDVLTGGSGPDRFSGGKGSDTADYTGRTDPLFLSLDNLTNDGADQEFDKIDYDIETILGGSGNDSISAGAFPATLDGRGGNDTLTGGSQNDIFIANDGAIDTIDGGDGDDVADLVDNLDVITNV